MQCVVVNKKDSDYDISITRPSKWGNPFPLHEFKSRGECLATFQRWLLDRRSLLADLHELRGKRLGCVCHPLLCHGDVYARMVNNPFTLLAYAELRVVITGSRHWTEDDRIYARLAKLPPYAVIGHGDSPRGVDRKAGKIAEELGLRVIPYPVVRYVDGPWPAAGILRNERMLKEHNPSLVIAFRAGGKSNGTDDCISRAREKKLELEVIHETAV
jgi:hypothetical protein